LRPLGIPTILLKQDGFSFLWNKQLFILITKKVQNV